MSGDNVLVLLAALVTVSPPAGPAEPVQAATPRIVVAISAPDTIPARPSPRLVSGGEILPAVDITGPTR